MMMIIIIITNKGSVQMYIPPLKQITQGSLPSQSAMEVAALGHEPSSWLVDPTQVIDSDLYL